MDGGVWELNSVAGLVRWLANSSVDEVDSYAQRLSRHAGATAFKMVPHPKSPEHEAARTTLNQFWTGLEPLQCGKPDRVTVCGNVNEPGVLLRYWWPAELAQPNAKIPPSPGFVVLDESVFTNEPERHLAWRRWLWLFNIFQTLPGFLLATRTGLDVGDHRNVRIETESIPGSGGSGAAHAGGWETVITQAMESLVVGLQTLRDKGVPAPEEVGFELSDGGEVVAEAELAWINRKLVLLMPHHLESENVWKTHGWTTVLAENEWCAALENFFEQQSTASNQNPEA